MGDLVPEVVTGFLHDVGVHARRRTVLEDEDMAHLDRLAFPIQPVSGQENRMFVPESTERSYERLALANGPENYTRTVSRGLQASRLLHRQGSRPGDLARLPERAGLSSGRQLLLAGFVLLCPGHARRGGDTPVGAPGCLLHQSLLFFEKLTEE